ncbi:polysaccharide pyruvyl transferase family protein [candidate division KSB1 bacterium]
MKSLLLSTSCLWNCGDDFIREGVLNLLQLKQDIRILFWNRAFGVSKTFANDLKVNMSQMDYFVLAGTPQWAVNHKPVYKYCMKKGIPFSLIGVGTAHINKLDYNFMKKVAQSNLCEIALARDRMAEALLRELGFTHIQLMLDPAFFMPPLPGSNKYYILGWRELFQHHGFYLFRKHPYNLYRFAKGCYYSYIKSKHGNTIDRYNELMVKIFSRFPTPKLVVVHDNMEIELASELFPDEHIYYSTDYQDIRRLYAQAKLYVGSRIHGSLPSLIHGAPVQLIYATTKAQVVEVSKDILSKYFENDMPFMQVKYINKDKISIEDFSDAADFKSRLHDGIQQEKARIRQLLKNQKSIAEFMQ